MTKAEALRERVGRLTGDPDREIRAIETTAILAAIVEELGIIEAIADELDAYAKRHGRDFDMDNGSVFRAADIIRAILTASKEGT